MYPEYLSSYLAVNDHPEYGEIKRSEYSLGLENSKEQATIFNVKAVMGSLTKTSAQIK